MSGNAIVIGAGVNGLTTAHLLARAGRKVVVLDQQPTADTSTDLGWVPPALVAELSLTEHGLKIHHPDPWILSVLADGGTIELWHDVAKSAEVIRQHSAPDAAKWPEFCERMRRLGRVLEMLCAAPPPDVETTDVGEMLRLAGIGLKVKRMGRQAMLDLIRILPMSAAELLDDWFESDALKGVLGAVAVMHLHQGPRSGGTAFSLLHHHVGSPAGVFRSPRSNLKQVLAGVPGVEIRRGAEVTSITVKAGSVTGVVLKSGEALAAPIVASSADPRRTLIGLLETGWLDPDFSLAIENIKYRGVAATVTLTLNKAAEFRTLVEAPSLNYLERAYDDAKYGRMSGKPWFEARAEGNRLIIHAQYAPYHMADGGWTEARRNAFADAVVNRLYECVPALKPLVVGRAIETPVELERRSGLSEGHAYQGELTLDQILFMRPVPGWGQYKMPVDGLYLCGAGTHPGGAIAGASGRNAAREILKHEK